MVLACADMPARLAPLQWDPLGLGANEERLTWFAEAERVHARWAMLAVAGILVQVGCRIGVSCMQEGCCWRGLPMWRITDVVHTLHLQLRSRWSDTHAHAG